MTILTEKTTFRLIVASLILGTAYRLWPVVAGTPALAQFFMTEDGYLMLTIARNMAIGLGMSVSDGTTASNGVQPLATFLFSVPYLLTNGDKVLGLTGVHLIAAAISVGGLFAVRSLARDLLRGQDDNPLWPWFVAALWFLGPLLLFHTMNGLETGLYTAMIALTLVLFGEVLAKGPGATFADRMILGAACGVTFLARNDGAFLVTAIFLVWGLHNLIVQRDRFVKVVADLLPPGVLSLIIAAPWLINNYVNFGSIVPVSGTAQALSGGFAKNVDLLPAILFENTFPMFPIPAVLQSIPAFQVIALLLVLLIVAVFVIQTWKRGGPARYVTVAFLIFATVLSIYYGLYFGAGWFLSRYLSPLAPFTITAVVSVFLTVVGGKAPEQRTSISSFVCLAALVLCIGLLGRALVPGVRDQGHFQVVDWVTTNVPAETWVGAVQTGTLGYWHDRTINLDGKVNPAALQAILTEGHILDYVLESPIEVLADWQGLLTWMAPGYLGVTAFSENFEVVVHDPVLNLGVLERVK